MSTTAKLVGPSNVYGVGPDTRTTTQKMPLGSRAVGDSGEEFVYIKAEGTIAIGVPVDVTNGVGEAAASTSAKGFAAIAHTAFADEEYGYAQSKGRVLALVPSGVSLGDSVTAGNGALSSTLTSGVKFATVQEAPVLLSGTTQLKYVFLH